ncbi:ATP-grasp domain-containing protein [Gracilibacillus sp. YIM 98692]|uniref:ATP-grasp domain-containing protein n=1 Tax=Gracilibacillus sp. YIM 98692 TaxID=2663532 RepID=UPI0013D793DC|nr:ATP-grasp domain-containing protein [Gracilibacillus sp. YIM 98692]
MTFDQPTAQEISFKQTDQTDRKIIENIQTGPKKLKITKPEKGKKIALIGWSIPTIEAMDQLKRPYVVVSLPEFNDYAKQHNIPFFAWDFNNELGYQQVYQQAKDLSEQLRALEVDHAIPLFEETVEWAGALNAYFRNEPRVFHHSILFRDKAMMKRRAHIGGLRVGVFEEGNQKEDVKQFFQRVNDSLLRHHGEDPDPVHIKALNKAGAAGHRMIRSVEDIDQKLSDDNFPCLMESHLDGIEVSCEAFIHQGKVLFLNITEYVVFGYSMMVPPSPDIEEYRSAIRNEVQKVVDAFDIEYGIIHPEFFITNDDEIYFGEVAYRIPGGHIFDLMQKAYQFNPYVGHILCSDPHTSTEELDGFFPQEDETNGHAGSFLVYPKKNFIQGVNIPDELEEHPGFDKHTLYKPMQAKVQDQEGYGNHLGTLFFHHEDHEQVKQPLTDYVDHDFFM